MKRIAGMVGAVLVSSSLLSAGQATAAPSGSTQVPAPGTVGTTSPASSVTQQDSGDISVDGAHVNNSTQGTVKSAAVDGQVNASGTQGQMRSTATDGTETQSQLAAPQFKAAPASSSQ